MEDQRLPLVSSERQADATSPELASSQQHQQLRLFPPIIAGLIALLDGVLGWVPFIFVQAQVDSYSPFDLFAIGCGLAVFVVVFQHVVVSLQRWRRRSMARAAPNAHILRMVPVGVSPRALDVGQVVLFGAFWVLCAGLGCRDGPADEGTHVESDMGPEESHRAVRIDVAGCVSLQRWFNTGVNGGMALIMLYSLKVSGRPFVTDFVECHMPPFVWEALSSRKWFLDPLIAVAWRWTLAVAGMAAITAVPAAWDQAVGIFESKGGSGGVTRCPDWLADGCNAGQYVLLGYAFWRDVADRRAQQKIKARIEEVKKEGVDSALYGPLLSVTRARKPSQKPQPERGGEEGGRNEVEIRSLVEDVDLQQAAEVLAAAFEHDPSFKEYLPTRTARTSWMLANVRSLAHFRMVLGCFETGDSGGSRTPKGTQKILRAVMACVPVYSVSKEEVVVFTSHDAWTAHGLDHTEFITEGSNGPELRLPDDDLIHLAAMKQDARHGLLSPPNLLSRCMQWLKQSGTRSGKFPSANPFIYVAEFGSDPNLGRGRGYAGALWRYLLTEVADPQGLPVVLETTTAENVAQYAKSGLRVIDRLGDHGEEVDSEGQHTAARSKKDWVLMRRDPLPCTSTS